MTNPYADFMIAIVQPGEVGSYNYDLCRGYETKYEECSDYGLMPIRPIVELSADFEVEETSPGVYDLVQ